ncbi:MAG: DUF1622 domain-containing protein [Rhodococcus sp.]|nr:DUF1622 domain-containing protein [Rhodococcus sp. (in: high G+C Gram-positive bacteria)]
MAEGCAALIEAIGVLLIVVLAVYAMLYGLFQLHKRESTDLVFQQVRQRLGRGILLGLEFLIAADIIHTVAVDLNFETVGVLAIIVLIRTFLSFTLEVELTGRWPWQGKDGATHRSSGETSEG